MIDAFMCTYGTTIGFVVGVLVGYALLHFTDPPR
jgi:uncharacterized membrane-anchored protein YhcB (DUF1043 family)